MRMTKYMITLISLLLFLGYAVAADKRPALKLPLPYADADSYTNQSKDSAARIQINVNRVFVGDGKHQNLSRDDSTKFGAVALCSTIKCWKYNLQKSIKNIPDAKTGQATQIADIVLPFETITDVYFLGDQGALEGHMKLPAPLTLESGFFWV